MSAARGWCAIFVVAAACTCGARTECSETAQISFLTSVHDDPSCAKLSTKGVVLYEAAGLLAETHNNRTDDFKIEITVLDTCGNLTGALKATLKALVWADVNCLRPPHYLGIIGPDTTTNAEAVHKVTSILKVPHIVKEPSTSPYLHPLAEESNSYVVQAILRTIDTLRWRSFTLIVTNANDENVQNIAKKLTMSAIARDWCVIVHDEEDYTSHIVHIGEPEDTFLRESVNATVLIVGECGSRDRLTSRINSSNNVLLLLPEDSRIVIDGLERRIESSQWWASENARGKYDAEELRQVRWLEDAVGIYTKALKALCKGKKCKNQINPLDWNRMVSSVLMAHNVESQAAPRFFDLFMRKKTGNLERLGGVIVRKDKARVYWGELSGVFQKGDAKEAGKNDGTKTAEDTLLAFRGLLNRENEPRSGCATTVKEIKMVHEKDNEATQVLVSGMDDNEWWTLVWTVSGVGVAMFLMGALAVYVIYTNVQNSRCPKGKDQLDRGTSLRRISNDQELPTTVTTHHQRTLRVLQRMGSDRSSVSEKSV